MLLGKVFEDFIEASPIAVMARGTLEKLLNPAKVDDLFERCSQKQYTRELLFSTAFSLMAEVVWKSAPTINAAHQSRAGEIPVSVASVYNKLQGVEPKVSAELVRESARESAEVLRAMRGTRPPLLPGYRTRIVDGNHLAAVQHRLRELRTIRAGALPGQALVVFDPEPMLIVDVIPCEDAHSQERSLFDEVLRTVKARDLWIGDRNFCTTKLLFGIVARGGSFVIRQHASTLSWILLGQRTQRRKSADGVVCEQRIRLLDKETGGTLVVRRVTLRLNEPTRDGETEIHILTNVPRCDAGAGRVAEIYRQRWTIEGMFQEITQNLQCEINTLAYPKAALFGFCLALVAYNAMSVVNGALRATFGADEARENISGYYLCLEMARVYPGMMIALPPRRWRVFRDLTAAELARTLLAIAKHVNLAKYQKHRRGPKKPPPKKTSGAKIKHVSIARLIALR